LQWQTVHTTFIGNQSTHSKAKRKHTYVDVISDLMRIHLFLKEGKYVNTNENMILYITITIVFSSQRLGPLALSHLDLLKTRYSTCNWKTCMRNQTTEHYHMITQEHTKT